MARYGSADVGFLVANGLNILGTVTQIEDVREAIIEETTALGVPWESHAAVGVKRFDLSQQGFYDDAANSSNAALVNPGASVVLAFAPAGNVAGRPFVGSPMVQVDYVRNLSRGALHKANASYKSTGNHDEGVILHALGAETANGNTEGALSQDAGVLSSLGGAGYLEMTALTLGGFTNLAVKVRHSADDITYADLVTFTPRTAIGGERIAVAGTVNRHLASSWAYTGAGAGNTATFMVGFARS
jgi:hypothetical protein